MFCSQELEALFPWPSSPSLCCTRSTRLSAADFFADTPWLEIHPERLGNISVEPVFPRGGLLGGSFSGAKPQSKLAALAAARKKAAEDKKRAAENGQDAHDVMPDEETNSTIVMDRLSALKKNTSSPSVQPATSAMKNLSLRTYPKRQKLEEPEPEPVVPEPVPVESLELEKPKGPTAEELTAPPSVFARTMLGSSSNPLSKPRPASTTGSASLFTMPYPHDPKQTNDPFAGPSPDDVVIKAQTKGSH